MRFAFGCKLADLRMNARRSAGWWILLSCISLLAGCGYITAYVRTVPPADPGRFNIQIDGTTQAVDASDAGVVSQVKLATGSHTMGETAGTGTDLGDFTVAISGDCDPVGKFFISHGDDKSCTITNTRTKNFLLNGHPCVTPIMAGTPYNMDDPNWFVMSSTQNKDICAYKFFSVFHMLGYNTDNGGSFSPSPHLDMLHAFQSQYGLPVNNLVTPDVILKLAALLALQEAKIAAVAKTFPLYDHMLPLHPNDIPKDWLAYVYQLPMSVLPAYLQMASYETAQCIWGQCVGFLRDANDANLPCQQNGCFTADLNVDYRFVGAYFDPNPNQWNTRLPSASAFVGTVLHEYAHYLDGSFASKFQTLPHMHMIDTFGFYDITYDMSQRQSICAPRRSNDPKDWITKYGFAGSVQCPQGMENFMEDWAEAFSMYVQDGKGFRAAAQRNATIAKTYDWLKANVFQGMEYDTDLQREIESGCNDVPGYAQSQPGYASCNVSYVWDGALRIK